MQIERHTYNMLQCHPCPCDFTDKARPFQCSYFMGLQRKQGIPVNEVEQFDIRLTVEEFKQAVNVYTMRKSGMEIYVSHVRRKNIPNFVFPGGVRPPRPKTSWDMRRAAELRMERSPESKAVNGSAGDVKKRKRDEESDPNTRNPKHVACPPPSSVEVAEASLTAASTGSSSYTISYDLLNNGIEELSTKKSEYEGSASSKEVENLAIEKVANVTYVGSQTSVEELDELDGDLGYKDHPKEIPKAAKGISFVSLTSTVGATSASSGNVSSPLVGLYMGSNPEELEVLPADLLSFLFVSDSYVFLWP